MRDYYSMIELIADKAGWSSSFCGGGKWIESESEFENNDFLLNAKIAWDPEVLHKKSVKILYKGKEVYYRNHTFVRKNPGVWEKKLQKLYESSSSDP